MGWSYTLEEIASAIHARSLRNGADTATVRVSGVSSDTRTLKPGDLYFALKGERFDGDQFVAQAFEKGACAAVCTPNAFDVSQKKHPLLFVADAQTALQRFARMHRLKLKVPVLALTGSAGKTTTKDLIAGVLASKFKVIKTEGNLNNEIGCPMSLLRLDESTEFAVIEMGANHMGEIARLCEIARPTESLITIVAPAHLEGFGSIDNVAKAKGEILHGLHSTGTFYVNMDDPRCAQVAEGFTGKTVRVGRADNPAFTSPKESDVVLESAHLDDSGELCVQLRGFPAMQLPLGCLAHATNVMLAVAVALQHGITDIEGPLRAACSSTTRFKRMTIGPLTVIDDSYNANPASMSAALESLARMPGAGARIAALGDMLELGEAAATLHAELGARAHRDGVDHIFVRGDFAESVVSGAKHAGMSNARAVIEHSVMARLIAETAKPGDILLVKGSRGMKMEKVIEALRALYE